MTIHLTEHARKRLRERLATSDAAAEDLAEQAYWYGTPPRALPWQLALWMRAKAYVTSGGESRPRLYEEHLFVFDDARLVTVYALRRDLVSLAVSIR